MFMVEAKNRVRVRAGCREACGCIWGQVLISIAIYEAIFSLANKTGFFLFQLYYMQSVFNLLTRITMRLRATKD